MHLLKLDKIKAQLATTDSVDEAVDLRNKARAVETYAKSIDNCKEIERTAIIIRLRCERKLGELLAKTVKAGNPQLSPSGRIGKKLSELGISANQSSRYQTVAKLPEDEFESYLETSNDLSTNSIIKVVREHERQAERHGPPSGHNIITGDITKLHGHIDDDSVDMFFTDPPYGELDCYSQLAGLASAKLKPGGLCLAYSGTLHLAEVMSRMSDHLTYWWTFSIRAGGGNIIHARGIKTTWKPVLAFAKPPNPKANYLTDQLQGGPREKGLHIWQQDQGEAEYLIERLTQPGDLVVDPFVGSGTTLAAAKQLGRNYLGCEIDSGTAKMARRRLAA